MLFLRDGGIRGGKEEEGEQTKGGAHQQLYVFWVCSKLINSINAQAPELKEPDSDADD